MPASNVELSHHKRIQSGTASKRIVWPQTIFLFLSFLVYSLKKGHKSCTANSILIGLSFLVFVGPWLTGELGLKRHFRNKNVFFFL